MENKQETKEKFISFEVDDKTYKLCLGFNVIAEIQERYGNFEDIFDKMNALKDVRWLLTVMLNDAVMRHNHDYPIDKWKELDEWEVGEIIGTDVADIKKTILTAFGLGLPDGEEKDEELAALIPDIGGEDTEKN